MRFCATPVQVNSLLGDSAPNQIFKNLNFQIFKNSNFQIFKFSKIQIFKFATRGGEWFQPVKGPQVNTSNPISALSAARSTEFRARHCGFLIPFALEHTNGGTGRTRPPLKRVLL